MSTCLLTRDKEQRRRAGAPPSALVLLGALVSIAACGGQEFQAAGTRAALDPATRPAARGNEVDLWEMVKQQPRPHYPRSSLQAGRGGVAVTALRISIDGTVAAVEVLEAPDAAIRESADAALRQWTFSMPDLFRERNVELESKITLYFLPEGEGVVLNAVEMMRRRNKDILPSSLPGGSDLEVDSVGALVQEIDESALAGLLDESNPVLVDLRERESFQRGHRPGAINIPYVELPARGPAEIPPGRPIVLDCSHREIPTIVCQGFASNYANRAGIRQVTLVLPGRR